MLHTSSLMASLAASDTAAACSYMHIYICIIRMYEDLCVCVCVCVCV